jgi:hypothetical protein
MTANKAFWRAVHSLAHPVTIAAVIGLLLNDHLLRHNWPSWWTALPRIRILLSITTFFDPIQNVFLKTICGIL